MSAAKRQGNQLKLVPAAKRPTRSAAPAAAHNEGDAEGLAIPAADGEEEEEEPAVDPNLAAKLAALWTAVQSADNHRDNRRWQQAKDGYQGALDSGLVKPSQVLHCNYFGQDMILEIEQQ